MIDLARAAARAAGAIQRDRPAFEVQHKGRVDLVTQVDLACEDAIRAALAPSGIPVLGEEGGGSEATTRWIVDPLDGTTNFVHGFPFFCVSIALEVEGELEIGVVYEPLRDLLFEARRGQGAWLGNERLRVSERRDLADCLLASGFAYRVRDDPRAALRMVEVALTHARGFRRAGSAALDLSMVACGQLDGFWELDLSAWDVAAGTLLVREAGGVVSDLRPLPFAVDARRILATNGHIHEALRTLLLPLLP